MPESPPLHTETWLVSAGRDHHAGAPLNTPIVPASNFILGKTRAYARDHGTPTWEALEEIVGGLEGGRSLAFSSGMAAVSSVFDLIPYGAEISIPTDCYQGVTDLAESGVAKGIWKVNKIPVEDTQAWISASRTSDLVWLESPSNPLLIVADLEAICQADRKKDSILAVDSTFSTPINLRPLEIGAEIAVQSATKFIGGHSDLLAGVATTRKDDLFGRLRQSRGRSGATPGALEAFLAVRGARTMALRLDKAQKNAAFLAQCLQSHPQVVLVRYPGLPSHPTHAVAARQLGGYGTIISFDIRGSAEDADAVCAEIRLIQHATSLGAVESTMERRAAVPGQEHLPPGMIRLSVGIEHPDDLWDDLSRALRRGISS